MVRAGSGNKNRRVDSFSQPATPNRHIVDQNKSGNINGSIIPTSFRNNFVARKLDKSATRNFEQSRQIKKLVF